MFALANNLDLTKPSLSITKCRLLFFYYCLPYTYIKYEVKSGTHSLTSMKKRVSEYSRLIYANRKFYVRGRILKGIIFQRRHREASSRHIYGLISLHLTPINSYKLPIIAYLLLASIAAVWKSCQVGFAAGSFAKEIWKLNSTQLTNETCFLLALYHWLQLLYCYFLALLSTK